MGSIGPEPAKGVDQDDLVMPIINFSNFLHGSPDQKLQTAEQISHAFQTSGFLYLADHGLPDTQVKEAFALSARFFDRPKSQKDQLAWTTAEANRGYVESGREKVTNATDADEIAELRSSNPDLKETFEMGREGEEDFPNHWPENFDDEGKKFTEFMKEFHTALKFLHDKVMSAIAVGTLGGLDAETFFDNHVSIGDNTLRLLHYPPVQKSVFKVNPHQVRAGEHSDYGSVTLLLQDSIGGLEVKSPQGTWVRAKPIPGTIVVNAGDLLMRWTNDVIISTKHRVIAPPPKPEDMEDADDENAMFPARYSIAYFGNPNFNSYIESLPIVNTVKGGEVKNKYKGVYAGEYLAQRLRETF